MKERLEHWKEGVGVLLYFAFLAFFTPKAEAMGWGYQGILFCVLIGALLVFLLYMLVKAGAQYVEEHRPEIEDYKEYMGIGSQSAPILDTDLSISDQYSLDELDAMLATNPYATADIVGEKFTHLLATVQGDEDYEDDEDEDLNIVPHSGSFVDEIIGENPRRRLEMSDNFQPDANSIVGTGVAVFAMSGSGKTQVVMRFVEQLVGRFHLPCVIFDSQGDALSLVEDGFFHNGHIAVPGRVPSMQKVLEYGLQVVFNLSEWHKPGKIGMDRQLAGALIAEIINELILAQYNIAPAQRRTCPVVLDETQLWVPQGRNPGGMTSTTANELYAAVMSLSTTGRKLALTPLFAGPRIAMINNDIISNVETRIFGKADLDNDLTRYHEYFGKDIASDDVIRSLRPGEMIVCTGGKYLLTKFYQRETRHVSATPSVTQGLERHMHKLSREMLDYITSEHHAEIPATPHPDDETHETPSYTIGYQGSCQPEPQYAGVDPQPDVSQQYARSATVPEMPALPPAVTGPQSGASRPPATPAERPARSKMARQALENSPELQQALELWKQGYRTARPLAKAMNKSHGTANKYLDKLRLMGEIPPG